MNSKPYLLFIPFLIPRLIDNMMKVRYIRETKKDKINYPKFFLYFGDITINRIYEVFANEKGWYRIIDDSDEDYLYPSEYFEIVNENKD